MHWINDEVSELLANAATHSTNYDGTGTLFQHVPAAQRASVRAVWDAKVGDPVAVPNADNRRYAATAIYQCTEAGKYPQARGIKVWNLLIGHFKNPSRGSRGGFSGQHENPAQYAPEASGVWFLHTKNNTRTLAKFLILIFPG
jgi:hypothetical protein